MKAIVVMFDSLNRRMLPPYGGDWVHAPNFTRLAERAVTFDTCYAGSMPCMPARRELHTGRYNFLHRSWGPLEPFDDSVPEILGEHGVYTHLATDHQHYWEDGGAGYVQRYRSFELFRGQEGDAWKGRVGEPMPETTDRRRAMREGIRRQDRVNRDYLVDEADHPQTQTFDAGLHFLDVNHAEDRWLLQIETFDPHEPFFSYDRHRRHYPGAGEEPGEDWPDYRPVVETPEEVARTRRAYAALVSKCDESLGRVLDAMDRHELWDDTMLIVCTDHGFLLGEHGWWGKNAVPWYDETIHTPLFVWDPRSGARGERRRSLVQTIDLGPTLLELFGLQPTIDMQGRALRETIASDAPVRGTALFGAFGGHVSVTDGRYVYMRAPLAARNEPLVEHTLIPTHMRSRFTPEELRRAELGEPLPFTKGAPVLRIPAVAVWATPHAFGTLLFDLDSDADQQQPLQDDALELRMAQMLVERLRAADAPAEQYERLGLPRQGEVRHEHLLVREQWPQVERSARAMRPAAGAAVAAGATQADAATVPAAEEVVE